MRKELQELAEKLQYWHNLGLISINTGIDKNAIISRRPYKALWPWVIVKELNGTISILHKETTVFISTPTEEALMECFFDNPLEALETYEKYLDKIQNQ
jgi:hypothetical protein